MRETLEGKGQLEKWQNCWPRRRICCGKKLATGSFGKYSCDSECTYAPTARIMRGAAYFLAAISSSFLR
jgi:hypothetical protein